MITVNDILDKLNNHSKEHDYFIVDAIVSNTNKISVFVDSLNGISIGDCAKINKWLRKQFEEELDVYELIVSTPGLDQPFKTIQQYQKNQGREVEVLQKDGQKLTGVLLNSSANQFTIESEKIEKNEKGKKQKIKEQFNFKMEDIKSVKVVIKI